MTEIDFDINKYFNNLRLVNKTLLLKTTHFTRTNVTGTDLLGSMQVSYKRVRGGGV